MAEHPVFTVRQEGISAFLISEDSLSAAGTMEQGWILMQHLEQIEEIQLPVIMWGQNKLMNLKVIFMVMIGIGKFQLRELPDLSMSGQMEEVFLIPKIPVAMKHALRILI
ncbi:MAG: hypothetical protein KKH98_04815 [Spirochaetes bacterium]|nr:hypothetical protein [Spirochaetota bacterium]